MKLALFSAISLQVAAAGAQVTPRGMWAIVRRPLWLPRIVLAMFVAVPLLAVVLAKTFDVPPAMDGAMLLLAISAAALLLPGKLLKLGIEPAYDATLAAVTTVLAIVLVPLELNLLAAIFLRDATISVGAVARVVGKSFLLSLAFGMALNAAPRC